MSSRYIPYVVLYFNIQLFGNNAKYYHLQVCIRVYFIEIYENVCRVDRFWLQEF